MFSQKDLNILDLGFGFRVKNYVHSRLETSGSPQFGQNITKMSFENKTRIIGLYIAVSGSSQPKVVLKLSTSTLVFC